MGRFPFRTQRNARSTHKHPYKPSCFYCRQCRQAGDLTRSFSSRFSPVHPPSESHRLCYSRGRTKRRRRLSFPTTYPLHTPLPGRSRSTEDPYPFFTSVHSADEPHSYSHIHTHRLPNHTALIALYRVSLEPAPFCTAPHGHGGGAFLPSEVLARQAGWRAALGDGFSGSLFFVLQAETVGRQTQRWE